MWSDYDEIMYQNIIDDYHCPLDFKYITWIKSLKETLSKQRWVPTEEQMNELWNVIDLIKLEHEKDIDSICALTELYEQLKQL